METRLSRLNRLTWSQVREHFENEWVELIDYRWDWNTPNPRWAIIRHSAGDRRELMSKINRSGSVSGAVILHVGAVNSIVASDSLGAAL